MEVLIFLAVRLYFPGNSHLRWSRSKVAASTPPKQLYSPPHNSNKSWICVLLCICICEPQARRVFLQWLPWLLRYSRPAKKITRKSILMENKLAAKCCSGWAIFQSRKYLPEILSTVVVDFRKVDKFLQAAFSSYRPSCKLCKSQRWDKKSLSSIFDESVVWVLFKGGISTNWQSFIKHICQQVLRMVD